jgi:hypothetical protein
MSTREWITLGCGVAAGVLAVVVGLPVGVAIALAVLVAAAAVVAVLYTNSAGLYIVLIVVAIDLAVAHDRPPAWQIMLVAAALAGFMLAPTADRRDLMSLLAAAVGVPLAGAVTVLAQHEGRGSAPYVIGLVALIVAVALAVRPALHVPRRTSGKSS